LELVSLKNVSVDSKIALLKRLGYDVDEAHVFVLKDGKQVIDKYADIPVRLDNMAILPGSTVVLDDNPLSVISYLEEYGDIL